METCAICLDKLLTGKNEILILPCKHIYHKCCFYNNIKINGYKCPYRCDLDITKECILQRVSEIDDTNYIEKLTKRIILPYSIEKILKNIKWEEDSVFIAGGFALSLYNNFNIPYTDIDIMCYDLNSINFTEFFLNNEFSIHEQYSSTTNYIIVDDLNMDTEKKAYLESNNNIEKVIKIINTSNKENINNLDIVKLIDDKYIRHNKLTNVISTTLERFDLSCCKIACTYQKDNNFTFYISTDFYNNRAYLDKNNEAKRINTLKRIAKYNKKGFQNIEIIEK